MLSASTSLKESVTPNCAVWYPHTYANPHEPAVCLPVLAMAGLEKDAYVSVAVPDFADCSNTDFTHIIKAPLSTSSCVRLLEWSNQPTSDAEKVGLLAVAHEDSRLTLMDMGKMLRAHSEQFKHATHSAQTTKVFEAVAPRPDFGVVKTTQFEDRVKINAVKFSPRNDKRITVARGEVGIDILSGDSLAVEHTLKNPETTSHVSAECTDLDWNQTADQIIGACFTSSSISVFDLRQSKVAMQITDPSRRTRLSSVRWVPTHGTCLIVGYDDDQNPSIQFWDLRTINFPYRELSGPHTRGITNLDFCKRDPNLFTSSSRDGKSITWTVNDRHPYPISEVLLGEPIIKSSISPTNPSLLLVSNSSNKVSIHNSMGRLLSPPSGHSRYVPLWLRKSSSGCTFGFGGKLCSFTPKLDNEHASELAVSTVYTDPELVAEASKFQYCLDNGDYSGYCQFMSSIAADSGDTASSSEWELIGTQFLEAPRQAERIQRIFGFDREHISQDIEMYLGHKGGETMFGNQDVSGVGGFSSTDPVRSLNSLSGGGTNNPSHNLAVSSNTTVDPQAFFTKLSASNKSSPRGPEGSSGGSHYNKDADNTSVSPAVACQENISSALDSKNYGRLAVGGKADWNIEPLRKFRQSFIIGDTLSAIEIAIKTHRFVEALVLARSNQDQRVWQHVLDAYMDVASDPFLSGVICSSYANYKALVRTSDLACWRDTIGILCTYVCTYQDLESPQSIFRQLCCDLGQRLENENGDVRSAVLCYTIAGDFSKALQVWNNMPTSAKSPRLRLQALAHKATVWQAATRFNGVDELFSKTLCAYGELLANSGQLVVAMKLLQLVQQPSPDDGHDNHSNSIAFLKYRIWSAGEQQMREAGIPPPPLPYTAQRIPTSWAAAQPSMDTSTKLGQTSTQQYGMPQQQPNASWGGAGGIYSGGPARPPLQPPFGIPNPPGRNFNQAPPTTGMLGGGGGSIPPPPVPSANPAGVYPPPPPTGGGGLQPPPTNSTIVPPPSLYPGSNMNRQPPLGGSSYLTPQQQTGGPYGSSPQPTRNISSDSSSLYQAGGGGTSNFMLGQTSGGSSLPYPNPKGVPGSQFSSNSTGNNPPTPGQQHSVFGTGGGVVPPPLPTSQSPPVPPMHQYPAPPFPQPGSGMLQPPPLGSSSAQSAAHLGNAPPPNPPQMMSLSNMTLPPPLPQTQYNVAPPPVSTSAFNVGGTPFQTNTGSGPMGLPAPPLGGSGTMVSGPPPRLPHLGGPMSQQPPPPMGSGGPLGALPSGSATGASSLLNTPSGGPPPIVTKNPYAVHNKPSEQWDGSGNTARGLAMGENENRMNKPNAPPPYGGPSGLQGPPPDFQRQQQDVCASSFDSSNVSSMPFVPSPSAVTGHPQAVAPPASTAPAHAAAKVLAKGMPVPWPIPTATQQVRSTNSVTETINQQIHETTSQDNDGDPCSESDVLKIQATLTALISPEADVIESRVSELIVQLRKGSVSKRVQQLLLSLSDGLDSKDWTLCRKLMHDIVQCGWTPTNKIWVMPLSRLVGAQSTRVTNI